MMRWLVGCAVSSALVAGGMYRERSLLVAETIAAAESQRAEAASKSFALETEIGELRDKERSQQLTLEDKMGTVEALWAERRRRVASETQRAADSTFCLPEAFSIVDGVTRHCHDSASKFPFFYEEFDLNASKLHTVNMLLDTARRRKSLQDIAPAMGGMFRGDPVLSAVSLLLHAEHKLKSVKDGDVLPQSTSELSKTFANLMQNFQDACVDAVREHSGGGDGGGKQQIRQRSKNNNNNDHNNSDGGDVVDDGHTADGNSNSSNNNPPLGFFVERIVPKVVDAAHMTTSVEADDRLQQEMRERERRRAVVASWNLYDNEDVFAAIDYVTSTHKDVVHAASSGKRWALHPSVAPAMKNLCVWSLAAEQYLAQAQTEQVLENIARCTSHAFVQVNKNNVAPKVQQ